MVVLYHTEARVAMLVISTVTFSALLFVLIKQNDMAFWSLTSSFSVEWYSTFYCYWHDTNLPMLDRLIRDAAADEIGDPQA